MTWDGIVVSVGGSPQPVITALLARRPAQALFVVSEISSPDVEEKIVPVLAAAGYTPQRQKAVVSDHQIMGNCYREIRARIARWLDECALDPQRVYVDITGGTKAMSAALALAGVEYCNDFTYIGGAVREPVTGRVRDGSEQIIQSANPWNAYAVRDLERANGLLRAGETDTAGKTLNEAAQRCEPSQKRRLLAFAALAEALTNSDRFDFAQALSVFNRQRNVLEVALDYPLFLQVADLGQHWEAVRRQVRAERKTPGRATLLELFANAERRARQGRYDDAVGRLYRAVELRVQQLVQDAFGAELGKASLEDFPADRRAAARAKLGEPDRRGRYELSLRRLFESLAFSNDAELRAQAAGYDNLHRHLQDRNNSLLAHGVKPVTEAGYQALWQAALAVCAVTDADIPRWPTLHLELPA